MTDTQPQTSSDEIFDGLFRFSTPVPPEVVPGGLTFNQFLIVDEEPLLFHTGPRRLFPATRAAVASVLSLETLRWIAFSHYEADECGALNEWLAVAQRSQPLCSQLAAMVSVAESRIGHHGAWPTVRRSRLGVVPCAGSIRHTSPTAWNAAICLMKPIGRSCAAISSPSPVRACRR